MLDTPEDEPVGPEWWEGRWPAGGIASLEDLERWVDSHLNEMILLNWTHPRLGSIARMIGRQAVRNATRYLDRNGRGDHPSQPIPHQLEHIEQIESALVALLRYIRREQGPRSEVVTPAETTNDRSGTEPREAAYSSPSDLRRRVVGGLRQRRHPQVQVWEVWKLSGFGRRSPSRPEGSDRGCPQDFWSEEFAGRLGDVQGVGLKIGGMACRCGGAEPVAR